MRNQRGFTLIELMVVVAIVAILSAIAISAYTMSIGKAQFSEALTVSDGLKAGVSEYFKEVGTCPTNGADGIDNAASYAGKYVASATVTPVANGCSITAQFRNSTIAPPLQGKQVTLTMIDTGGTVEWKCTTDAPPQYAPGVCR